MAANKFMAEYQRMCTSYAGCRDCPLHTNNRLCTGIPANYPEEFAAKIIKTVEEWSAAHPRKTRQDVFLEQYPEARIGDDGVLRINPCSISTSHRNARGNCATMRRECEDCRREFWMQEVE